MLFQPSEFIPSAIYATAGSDVIDATEENTFSFIVNSSGTTIGAYQLQIYENTTTSTSVYDSGIVELVTAFVPTSYDGTKNRMEITVPSNDSGEATYTEMVNEFSDGYKWTISLWETYDSGDPTDTKLTSFENSIKTKIPSILTIDSSTAPPTITTRSNLWKADFTTTSSIAQFKWYLAEVDGSDYNVIYETDWIYQSSQIWFYYDGLVSRTTYAVRVRVMTQNGVTNYSSWAKSNVSYSTLSVTGATTVTAVDGGLRPTWYGIKYIEGTAHYIADDTESTNYTIIDDYPISGQKVVDIADDTYIKFLSSETFSVDLDDDGTGVFAFYPDSYSTSNVTLFTIDSEDATQSRELKHSGFVAGLYPSDTLYPSDSLYPSAGDYGQLIYTINGDTYTFDCTTELPLTKYIAILGPAALTVYEFERE